MTCFQARGSHFRALHHFKAGIPGVLTHLHLKIHDSTVQCTCMHIKVATGPHVNLAIVLLLLVILPREHDVDYSVDHWHGSLLMAKRTANTHNSELFIVPLSDPSQQRLLLEHRHEFKIEDFAVFENFVAVIERSSSSGLQECRVFALPESKDPAGVCGLTLRYDLCQCLEFCFYALCSVDFVCASCVACVGALNACAIRRLLLDMLLCSELIKMLPTLANCF